MYNPTPGQVSDGGLREFVWVDIESQLHGDDGCSDGDDFDHATDHTSAWMSAWIDYRDIGISLMLI